MLDGATLFPDIDDLAMTASDLLDHFRKRGMGDLVQRTVVNRTLEANNLEKLKGLIAKFEATIQDQHAEVAAARLVLEDQELLASLAGMHEPFAPPCSTEMTASGATEGNTEGSCTITISHTERNELSHHQNYSNNGIYLKPQFECEIKRIESDSIRIAYMFILSGAE
jgi:hypothetical protein